MTYESSGNLVTDKQVIETSFEWNTQTEWEAYQSATNVEIDSGVVKLAIAIPPSVVHRWPFDEGSGTTAADSEGTADGTISGATWVSGTYIGDFALDFDGVDDYVDTGASNPAGAMTYVATVDFSSDKTDVERIQDVGDGANPGRRQIGFRGDLATNRLVFTVVNDADDPVFSVEHDLASAGRYRIAGILDPSVPEARIAVDGTVQSTLSVSGNFQTQASNHKIGRDAATSANFFGGIIDEPMIANEAWDSATLTDDYNRQPWT